MIRWFVSDLNGSADKSWYNYEYMNNKCIIIKNEYYERTDFVFCDCSV